MRSRGETYLYRRDMPGSERIGQYCRESIQDQWECWQAAEAAALERAAQVCDQLWTRAGDADECADAIRKLAAPVERGGE
jgi:hypothetical protein